MISHDLLHLLFAFCILLFGAFALGGFFRKLKLPVITGEILVGIILGPWMREWFHAGTPLAHFLSGFNLIAVILLLMLSGTDIVFSNALKYKKLSVSISSAGMILPFALGLAAALFFPELIPNEPGIDPWTTRLFFATAMSISALPVIAKTLMDLKLLQTDVGIITMTAAVFNDLVGWVIFAGILAMPKLGAESASSENALLKTLCLVVLFTVAMLLVMRPLIDRLLPPVFKWSGRVLAFCICFTLLAAAATEWMGVHALFGAFIAGIVIGDSKHFTAPAQAAVEEFVLSFFAPVFMATLGLQVDFVHHFDLKLTVVVVAVACIGKILGCGLTAKFLKLESRKAWAVGFGLNARGAMEIILGSIALQNGIIGEPLFVALVVMALVTSIITGPALTRLLGSNDSSSLLA